MKDGDVEVPRRPLLGGNEDGTYLRRILSRVFSLEVSSGALSAIYAAGRDVVVVSPEAVEGAVEGAGEFRSRFVDNPDEEEVMMTECVRRPREAATLIEPGALRDDWKWTVCSELSNDPVDTAGHGYDGRGVIDFPPGENSTPDSVP
jgi:hypothetical protein